MSRPTQVVLLTCARFQYGTVTLFGGTFQNLLVPSTRSFENSYNPATAVTAAVWALSISIATTLDIDDFFLFLQVLRCFSSLRLLQLSLVTGLQPAGLPHSEMHGSKPVCGSPCLIAAYHVLLRLRKPRHPPFALVTFFFIVQK